ncbi:hypothetical protein ACEUC3_19430 [Aeromonas bivalvium]|uniref:Uncharacterized protein n=1 Tax=Aeromonas bivalvium TaxID=440079 RepID=A0ABW9GSQ9_9GAMM
MKASLLLLLSPILLLGLGIGLLLMNSMGCNYEMRVTDGDLSYYGVCRWGQAHFIETDNRSGAEWSVKAFQLAVADQLLFIIQERRQLKAGDGSDSKLDHYNQAQASFHLLNYAWLPIDEKRIALFQTAPHHDVLLATREGPIHLMDSIFGSP